MENTSLGTTETLQANSIPTNISPSDAYKADAEKIITGWSWFGAMYPVGSFIIGNNAGLFILWLASYILVPIIVSLLFHTITPLVVVMYIYWTIFAYLTPFIIWFIIGGLIGKKIIRKATRFKTPEEKVGAIRATEAIGWFSFVCLMLYIIVQTASIFIW